MPLLAGAVLLIVMLTWRRGARILAEKAHREEVPLADFAARIAKRSPGRVEGTAIFLTGGPDNVPSALLHNLKGRSQFPGRRRTGVRWLG